MSAAVYTETVTVTAPPGRGSCYCTCATCSGRHGNIGHCHIPALGCYA